MVQPRSRRASPTWPVSSLLISPAALSRRIRVLTVCSLALYAYRHGHWHRFISHVGTMGVSRPPREEADVGPTSQGACIRGRRLGSRHPDGPRLRSGGGFWTLSLDAVRGDGTPPGGELLEPEQPHLSGLGAVVSFARKTPFLLGSAREADTAVQQIRLCRRVEMLRRVHLVPHRHRRSHAQGAPHLGDTPIRQFLVLTRLFDPAGGPGLPA